MKQAIERVPQMPLMLQENFTVLLEMLRTGELDCAILPSCSRRRLAVAPLYDERSR